MKAPLDVWRIEDEVESTQNLAASLLNDGIGVVFARHQTGGRGRFGRTWVSHVGDSLTVSFVFHDYRNHPRPHLIGMGVAIAAAEAVYSRLQWPNDLVIGGRKVGGILTEIIGGVPIVGVGINLNQSSFPEEIADRAASLRMATGNIFDAKTVARQVYDRLDSVPEPNQFADLAPVWSLFDATPGKSYLLASGDLGEAIGVGSEGQLICSVEGDTRTVLAADGIFGPDK